MRKGSLAIFVPHLGCPHQCSFCDQKAISGTQNLPTPEAVTALLADAKEKRNTASPPIEIAFFGGSFTAIDPGYRRSLLAAAYPFLGKNGFTGIRISTRPDAIYGEILSELKAYGVTVIELGAQSMSPQVLALSRRGHTPQDVVTASQMIREAGFSLGLQMMTGLPGDTAQQAEQTAYALAELYPDTMRIYPALTLKGTRLEKLYQLGNYHPPTLEETICLNARLLRLFHHRDIRVIRLGLHDSSELRAGLVAGPWHPALGELAEGQALADIVWEQLQQRSILPGPIEIQVAAGNQSKLTGHGRRSLRFLEAAGYHVTVTEQSGLGDLEAEAIPRYKEPSTTKEG